MGSDDRGRLVGNWPDALAAASLTLARRFSAGATLWCWSPQWLQHAEHVAVEFVHPVIVGKRALPAVAVTGTDPVSRLRSLTSSGDVLLVVAEAGRPDVDAVLRRAPAWGVTTFWLGAGPAPPATPVDHLLWYDGEAGDVAFSGAFVLAYHVLWELTHVCFEHPALMKPDGTEDCNGPTCITCADEGRLAEVVGPGRGATVVRSAAGLEDIDTTLVEPVHAGDLVLVHAGVAISRAGVGHEVEGHEVEAHEVAGHEVKDRTP